MVSYKNLFDVTCVTVIAVCLCGCSVFQGSSSSENSNRCRKLDSLEAQVAENSRKIKRLESGTASYNKDIAQAAAFIVKNGSNRISRLALPVLIRLNTPASQSQMVRLLDVVEPKLKAEILRNLVQVKYPGIHDIVINLMKANNPKDYEAVYSVLRYRRSHFLSKKDLPVMIQYLNSVSSDNFGIPLQSALLRRIMSISSSQGTDLFFMKLKAAKNHGLQNTYLQILSDDSIRLSYDNYIKIMDIVGSCSPETIKEYQSIVRGIRTSKDWRLTDKLIALIPYTIDNDSFKRELAYTLAYMKDPKAAPIVAKMSKSIRGLNLRDFPGLVKKGSNYDLVDDAKMKELMDIRKKRIDMLNLNNL